MASSESDLQTHSTPRMPWPLAVAIVILCVSAPLNIYGAMTATRAAALDSFGLLLAILAIVAVIALLRRAKIGRILGLILGWAMLYRISMTLLMLLTDRSNTPSSIPAEVAQRNSTALLLGVVLLAIHGWMLSVLHSSKTKTLMK